MRLSEIIDSNIYTPKVLTGFSGGSSGKEPGCQWRRHKRCGFDPLEEVMATHSSLLAWRIPMDRAAAWWATVHRVEKSRTWLKWLSTHAGYSHFQWQSTTLSGHFPGDYGWAATGGKHLCFSCSFLLAYILCANFISIVDICHLELSNISLMASVYPNYFPHFDSCLLKVESRKFSSWGLFSASIVAGDRGPYN